MLLREPGLSTDRKRLQRAPCLDPSPAPCLGRASPPLPLALSDKAFCWAESGHSPASGAPGEGPGALQPCSSGSSSPGGH